MNKIDVQIDKAEINNFWVYPPKEKGRDIEVHVNLDLFAGKNKIATVELGTNVYAANKKFKLPFKLYEHFGKIIGELEKIVTRQFKANLKELPANTAIAKEI